MTRSALTYRTGSVVDNHDRHNFSGPVGEW
jgi:hypothetical protein